METKQLSGYTDVHSMGKAGPGVVCSVLRLSPFRQALHDSSQAPGAKPVTYEAEQCCAVLAFLSVLGEAGWALAGPDVTGLGGCTQSVYRGV